MFTYCTYVIPNMARLQYIKCILSVCIWCFALCLSLFYFLELETYFEGFWIKKNKNTCFPVIYIFHGNLMLFLDSEFNPNIMPVDV